MLTPHFQPFPELMTDRLLLRQINLSDAPEIFFLRSNKDVLQFIGREPAVSVKEAEVFINMITQSIKENESVMWGIALRTAPSILIGNICYWRLQKENFRAEIGYSLHPQYWRKGIMKEAINKVLSYGFEVLKLHSVEARTEANNKASAAILEATGFAKEGYLKEEFHFRGRFHDSVIYSLLNPKARVGG
jgi:[ribosomal protein S5]-alanine N-acetyltransferase